MMGGRGSGKTAPMARYLHDHVYGPPCLPNVPGGHWPAIIGPTLGDAVTSCVNGPSGLRVHDPGCKATAQPGGMAVKWSNGVEGKIFGAHTPEDVERLRSGGNRCIVWAEELAAWRYLDECWQHMRYGLRVGPWPRVIISSTPKARKLIKKLFKDSKNSEETKVVLRGATTYDNPHLDPDVKRALQEDYEGTRLGQQELLGKLLEDVQNALWVEETIDLYRLSWNNVPPHFDRIVVAVDPAGTDGGDEHGIIVVGVKHGGLYIADLKMPHLPHGFILGDYTVSGSPTEWADAVKTAYRDFKADKVVAEVNFGGDMVKHTIQTADPNILVDKVNASRGKTKRAEPVSNLYEQGRMHHVGSYPVLEDQMCSWDPLEEKPGWSPDRMDAMVWGATALVVRPMARQDDDAFEDTRLKGRR